VVGYLSLSLGAIAMPHPSQASLSLSHPTLPCLVLSCLVLSRLEGNQLTSLTSPCHATSHTLKAPLIDLPVHCQHPTDNLHSNSIPCRSCQLSLRLQRPTSHPCHRRLNTIHTYSYRSTPANSLTYPPEIPGLAALRLRFPDTPIRLHP
jgi:hypothetical protein